MLLYLSYSCLWDLYSGPMLGKKEKNQWKKTQPKPQMRRAVVRNLCSVGFVCPSLPDSPDLKCRRLVFILWRWLMSLRIHPKTRDTVAIKRWGKAEIRPKIFLFVSCNWSLFLLPVLRRDPSAAKSLSGNDERDDSKTFSASQTLLPTAPEWLLSSSANSAGWFIICRLIRSWLKL